MIDLHISEKELCNASHRNLSRGEVGEQNRRNVTRDTKRDTFSCFFTMGAHSGKMIKRRNKWIDMRDFFFFSDGMLVQIWVSCLWHIQKRGADIVVLAPSHFIAEKIYVTKKRTEMTIAKSSNAPDHIRVPPLPKSTSARHPILPPLMLMMTKLWGSERNWHLHPIFRSLGVGEIWGWWSIVKRSPQEKEKRVREKL